MKIITIVGARPQFIKAAVVSHELSKNHNEIIVHTGQHYDYNMSEQFFEQLDIPSPKYNLGISGGSHARMTGNMMISIEEVLIKEKPDWVLLYGDTNSTLAAAIASAKLHIPICHVESGSRTYCMSNPEEINRVCTDHISSLLLTSTHHALDNLKVEGLADKALFVGNPMYEAFLINNGKIDISEVILKEISGNEFRVNDKYYYLTCHREENTNKDINLYEIFSAMDTLEYMTIYPVHPRNRERAVRLVKDNEFKNIKLVEPVGYLESICLVKNAQKIVTDSGGLQCEAFYAQKKCVTILDFECWPETMIGGRNVLASPNKEDILQKLSLPQHIDTTYLPFGNGNASQKIVQAIENYKEIKR